MKKPCLTYIKQGSIFVGTQLFDVPPSSNEDQQS